MCLVGTFLDSGNYVPLELWSPGEPRHDSGDCVVLSSDEGGLSSDKGGFLVADCNEKFGYICEP